jgi:hypothetical protein
MSVSPGTNTISCGVATFTVSGTLTVN